MRKIYVIGVLLFWSLIGQTRAQESLAKAFVSAVQANNPALLKAWHPTPVLVRMLEPERTKKLSDDAIKQTFLAPLQKKLAKDFANFQASAQKSSIELGKLQYVNFQLQRDEPSSANKPVACTITYSYGDKQGTFAVTVLEKQGKWYLFEVLRSVNIFEVLK
ncbi:MAG: hypothetical protein JST84_24860 [Acidobacteria bacterium]|nr:hypothetical protein [Acidobacteriota bacterium]